VQTHAVRLSAPFKEQVDIFFSMRLWR